MESYSLFIEYLGNRMIFDKPSAVELKAETDSELQKISSHVKRIDFFKAILTLWGRREIDAFYKGGCMEYLHWVQYKLQEAEAHIMQGHIKDWNNLYHDIINTYIKGISISDFTYVMNYKSLPNGIDKIKWLTKKTEALAFQEFFHFEMKQFNNCFIPNEGSRFEPHNRSRVNMEKRFQDLLTKHKL